MKTIENHSLFRGYRRTLPLKIALKSAKDIDIHRGLLYDSSQHSEPGNKANDYLAMRYRSIDHGRVSRRRQCLGNCSKCATSTSEPKNRLRYSGRRIRFHGRTSRSYCDDKNDVHQPRRNTFELKRETRRGTYVCTRREIQDDILQDKRVTMLHSSLSVP